VVPNSTSIPESDNGAAEAISASSEGLGGMAGKAVMLPPEKTGVAPTEVWQVEA